MVQPAPIRVEAFHLADFVHPADSELAGRAGLVLGYAVVHPAGVLLFDTGIGFGDEEIDAAFRPVVRSLPEALRDRGIDPDDVTAIANSHLHFDHCGQNAAFPDRPIHVQTAEYDAAHGNDYTIPAWVDFAGATFELHADDVDLLPGVRLIATPGHTPGHQSLLVDSDRGRTVIAGQAVYSRAEWDGADDVVDAGESSAWDRAAYRASVARLRAFQPDVILFGHDDR